MVIFSLVGVIPRKVSLMSTGNSIADHHPVTFGNQTINSSVHNPEKPHGRRQRNCLKVFKLEGLAETVY